MCHYKGDVLFRNDILNPLFNFKKRLGIIQRKSCYAFNIEERHVKQIRGVLAETEKIWRYGTSGRIIEILVLRDPFNLFASRLKARWSQPKGGRYSQWLDNRAVKMWKSYAQEFLGITTFYPSAIKIKYNDWFTSQEYRQDISRQLGLPFTDEGLLLVTDDGQGSSFDGVNYNGRANQMQVLDRWKSCMGNKAYLRVFQDEELMSLAGKIFGVPDGFRELLSD